MQNHPLTEEQIKDLLVKSQDCVLATNGEGGFPYAVPMNYVYHNEKIYMHGLAKGQKLDNIKKNPKVCVQIHEMVGLLKEVDAACDVNVEYNSVIILGNAGIVEDAAIKRDVLNQVVSKYTPEFAEEVLPEAMVRGTAVIEVTVEEITGKYYK